MTETTSMADDAHESNRRNLLDFEPVFSAHQLLVKVVANTAIW